jgi:broad specificity phosphatase PhoE
VILMRHGQTQFNVVYGATRRDPGIRDPNLTEEGRSQVTAAISRLRDHNPVQIIASPYARALESADMVAAAFGLPVSVEPIIGERAVFMCDVGTRRSELALRWPRFTFTHIDEEWWPDREEHEDSLEVRCRRFRAELSDNGGWRGTLVVTHWGVIRSLTGHRVQNADLVLFDPTAAHPGGGMVVPPADP